tara:strand:- start:20 stop:151 length:132 start_codon:yes stop_codon:yes gene_type:complete
MAGFFPIELRPSVLLEKCSTMVRLVGQFDKNRGEAVGALESND